MKIYEHQECRLIFLNSTRQTEGMADKSLRDSIVAPALRTTREDSPPPPAYAQREDESFQESEW